MDDLKAELDEMIEAAKVAFQDAAAMHQRGKVSYQSGRINAFKAVRDMLS